MAEFQCVLITKEGNQFQETYKAESKTRLIESLQLHGYYPISVEEKKETIATMDLSSNKLKLNSLILFCRQMSTLLKAGIPLISAFDITASQTEDKLLKKTFKELSDETQKGNSMSKAMESLGDRFPAMLVSMIEVGEATGDIPNVLERMANQYESDNRIKRKVKGAMTYPVMVLIIALLVVVFMLVTIVPQFVTVFESLGSDLPGMTKILLVMSEFVTQKWYLAILIVGVLIMSGKIFFAKKEVKLWIDHKVLTIKGLSNATQKIMAAEFARTLHTLISAGIPIVEAMGYANKNVSNTYANQCIEEVIVGLKKGQNISSQLGKFGVFPKLLISMINIGENSGNLEEMLEKTAIYFDEEMDAAISQIMSIIEPSMIVVLGFLIGFIVMALYSPMFGIISAMSSSL